MIIDLRPYVTCLCGTQIHAATLTDALTLFDHHVDQHHGRTFPQGAIRIQPGGGRRRGVRSPITPQGGQS